MNCVIAVKDSWVILIMFGRCLLGVYGVPAVWCAQQTDSIQVVFQKQKRVHLGIVEHIDLH